MDLIIQVLNGGSELIIQASFMNGAVFKRLLAASESQGAGGMGGAVQWAMEHQRLSPTALQCRSRAADPLITSAAHVSGL